MNKKDFCVQMNNILKLVRTESGLTQEKMAGILGISKKSYVESEKGRRLLAWNEAALCAAIFYNSSVMQNSFGGDARELMEVLAFECTDVRYPSTMGGKIWWRVIKEKDGYKIQQNIISNHYRLLNSEDQRLASSFDLGEIEDCLEVVLK